MQEIILNAELRQLGSNNETKTLRRNGFVPGIFYQRGFDNIPIYVKEISLNPIINSSVAKIINLTLPNIQYKTILKDIQYDPVTDRPVHFDLLGIREDEKISLEIPVTFVGTAVGQRDGGLVQRLLHKIKIECLPKDIPGSIPVNIEELKIGDSIHIKDLSIENVEILENLDATVVAIIPPTVEITPAVVVPVEGAAEEEKQEPEVVQAKGKKEETEEEKK